MARRAFHLGPLLGAFWVLLSGHYTVLLLFLGVLSVVLVVWIANRMDVVDRVEIRVRPSARAPHYAGWLVWKILLSALGVLRQVWSPRVLLRPVVGPTRADLSDVGRVAYANSITLTPGTLSLQVRDEDIEVHALEESGLAELHEGEMRERIRRLEAR
jgi:multicomponent Na+:H+ antiporter subunit E